MRRIETRHRGARSRYDTSVFEKLELSNGITVWVQRSPVLLTEEGILVAYFRNVGSVRDPRDKEGVAHFLEHMPFKGTVRYPTTDVISALIQDVGGGKNATTSRYWTSYFASAPAEAFSTALSFLSQALTAPLMRPEDFVTEQGVIESERARKFEHGRALAARDVDRALFGEHPAFSWGIGTRASIAAIGLEDILAFWKRHYHAGNLHLVVGGSFAEVPELAARLEEAFAGMAAGSAEKLILPAMPPLAAEPVTLADPRYGRDRTYLEWVMPGAISDSSMDALGLLASAFSDASDSPLAMELRDRRGLVYESGLLGEERIGDLGARVTLELPVASSLAKDIADESVSLLASMPEQRVALQLERWQLARQSSFHYPTSLCRSLGGEIAQYGAPRSLHRDQADVDDIDLDEVLGWQRFLSATPPTFVQTSSGTA